jgi:hypothetical protein
MTHRQRLSARYAVVSTFLAAMSAFGCARPRSSDPSGSNEYQRLFVDESCSGAEDDSAPALDAMAASKAMSDARCV